MLSNFGISVLRYCHQFEKQSKWNKVSITTSDSWQHAFYFNWSNQFHYKVFPLCIENSIPTF